jgi:hypothetical protein
LTASSREPRAETRREAFGVEDWSDQTSAPRRSRIEQPLVFPAEYKQACISILSYFAEVLAKKYPDVDATVQIEQSGQLVRMIIETQLGDRDIVEATLFDYQLVVAGRMQPEELLPEKLDVLELKHKLAMAKLEVDHMRELLAFAREEVQQSRAQLMDLRNKEDIKFEVLTNMVSQSLQSMTNTAGSFSKSIQNLARYHHGTVKNSLLTLSAIVNRGMRESDEEAIKKSCSHN